MNKFNALVLKSKNKIDLERNIVLPNLPKDKILVKIFYSGLCRSQLMEIEQKRGKDKFLPHMLDMKLLARLLELEKMLKILILVTM